MPNGLAATPLPPASPLATALLLCLIAGLAMPAGAFLARLERIHPRWLEREFRHAVVAFGGGVLLAAVALVLVPEGIRTLDWPLAIGLFLAGGLAFLLLDVRLRRAKGSMAQLVAMLADFIPEAIALGATFAAGEPVGVLLAVLITLQNLPEGFNAYRELRHATRMSPGRIIGAFALMALLGPVCGFAGFVWLAEGPAVVGGIMIAAAGGILYLTFEDIAPQARLANRHAPAFGAVCGFAVGLLGHMLIVG
jgi:ZIP family zinc transporter